MKLFHANRKGAVLTEAGRTYSLADAYAPRLLKGFLEKYNVRITHPQWLTGGQDIYLMCHRTRIITLAAQQLQNRILKESPTE